MIPHDYKDPRWDVCERVHCWRNYISNNLREIWDTFTDEQKAAIAESADDAASMEEWD